MRYGPDDQQTMDVFIPREISQNKPFAIIVHGGAWSVGNKRNIRMTQRYLYKKGIPSVNINYRLVSDENHLDEQLEDINLVVKSLDRELPKYGIKPEKYTLIGESSGAHIALLYGYAHAKKIKDIIAFFPPTDFTVKDQNKAIAQLSLPIMKKLLGYGSKEEVEKALIKASPIHNVTNVPTLIFQGTWDFIVNKKQAISLDSALAAKKVKHKLVLVKNGTHFMRLNPNTRRHTLYPEMVKWIEGAK
jgi:acetyl esterase/lipase